MTATTNPEGKTCDTSLTIGQLAELAGVSASALRFYEDRGLIRASRSRGNQRCFSRDMIRQVFIIRMAHHAGIPLAEIGDALSSLPLDRTPTERDWQAVSERWDGRLQDRIDGLMALRDDLPGHLETLCRSMEEGLEGARVEAASRRRSSR